MMHLQSKYWRHYLARSTLRYRIMQNECLSFTETRMIAEEVLLEVHAPPWIWGCWSNPSHTPSCVHLILCCSVTGWFCFSSWHLWGMAAEMCLDKMGRLPAEVSWETDDELGAARKGIWQQRGSWHTHWSRCTLPGTVQTKQRSRIKRLFPFRQNKVKKKAMHNSTLQFLVTETIFLSRVC